MYINFGLFACFCHSFNLLDNINTYLHSTIEKAPSARNFGRRPIPDNLPACCRPGASGGSGTVVNIPVNFASILKQLLYNLFLCHNIAK